MFIEYLSVKALNFPYITNKPAVLSADKRSCEVLQTYIFYIDDKVMGCPIRDAECFKRGETVYVEFLYKEHLLRLECSVKSFDGGIIYFRLPRRAEKIQQRGHLRVGCNIKCEIERLTTGKIKNISGGGAFIALDSPIGNNYAERDFIKIKFTLKNNDYRLECTIIELDKKFIRVMFNDIDGDVRERIVQYCCEKDLISSRGGRYVG